MSKLALKGMSRFAYSKDSTHVVEFSDDEGRPFSITIRQAGGSNRKYAEREAVLFKPHERSRQRGTLKPELALQLGAKLFAEAIVTDWSGLKTTDGEDFPCTPENVEEFLLNYEPIFDDLFREATTVENFVGGNEPAVKNSQKPSPGGSPGATG